MSTVSREPRRGSAAKTAMSPSPMPMTPLSRNQGTLALARPPPTVCANAASTATATVRRPRLARAPPSARALRLAQVALKAKKRAARKAASPWAAANIKMATGHPAGTRNHIQPVAGASHPAAKASPHRNAPSRDRRATNA